MKKFIAVMGIILISSNSHAARKCCHNHGGIVKCEGNKKHLCQDGYIGNCPKHNH